MTTLQMRLLWMIHTATEASGVPPTLEELASTMGSTRQAVCEVLKRLRRDGIIRRTTKSRSIEVIDPEVIQRLGSRKHVLAEARRIRRQKKVERDAARTKRVARLMASAPPYKGGEFELRVGDAEAITRTMGDETVDCIMTDPPYDRGAIKLYGALARIAGRLLRPGGNLLVMAGQSHLPVVLAQFVGSPLRYQWMIAAHCPGDSCQLHQRHVRSNWKPVLWYHKPGGEDCEMVNDFIVSDARDKSIHSMGQSESLMSDLVEAFSTPGQLILDPFCGSGTTGVAALKAGRQFIGIDIDSEAITLAAGRLQALNIQG